MTRLPAIVEDELKRSGRPYEIRRGSRHHKLFVAGRMTAILPYGSGSGDPRGDLNVRASVRRVLREIAGRGGKR